MSAGAELRKTAKALRTAREKSLRKSGSAGRKQLLTAGAQATGGDLVYSGEPNSKLGVTSSVKGGARITTLTLKPVGKSAGQWAWANTGTRAGARRYRSGRRRGTVMNHPGTPGRLAWDKTRDKLVPEIVDDLRNTLAVTVR